MTVYPSAIDSDADLPRIDNNITELGSDAINALRDSMFAVEQTLGINPQGSLSDVATRLNVSHNPDGTIRASALTSIGLVVLPVTNAQIGNTAGILESKLSLDFGTSSLHTLIQANSVLLASLSAFEAALETKLNSHIAGGPASNLRHVASHIDINATPSDSRDPGFTWAGLIDKDGYDLTATNVAQALSQINNNLTGHQNQITGAHEASAISVDTSNFSELLSTSDNVQTALQNIDNIELLQLGTHREVQHSNGVPNRALALNLNSLTTIGPDGYNIQVVAPTPITAHVAHSPPGTNPVDNVINGDSVVSFSPISNAGSIFDAQFSQVKVGDIIRLNYGLGIEDIRRVESIKYVPGSNWTVRINGVNLRDTDGYTVYARIDRPLYDTNTTGVLAVAAANAVPLVNYSILGSVIIADPRGANAIGINFNQSEITRDNYFLYLQLYPTGNPTDHVINLPGIDVSGNAGTSTGKYTLESVIQETNNAFRKTGYNYRFIAHSVGGNFAISLADSIDGAAFAIISGINSTGALTEGTYTKNVIGDVYGLGADALGFGLNNANLASPAYQATWIDATAAQIPTKVIHPVKFRNYIVNGRPFDGFRAKPLTTNGFWAADIDSKTSVGSSIEVTYKVNAILDTAGLKPGKTIVVQPAVAYTDGSYNDVDYGRFIIKEVIFNPCQCLDEYTLITVISGIHGTGNPLSSSSAAGLPVRLYFSEDSVGFNDQNIIDISENSINYHRFFEIYINDSKTTFAHERARMPYQTTVGSLITSNFFHIGEISPKFRGYRDSGSAFNKYIRFYVLNYITNTGEYDGYLGQRNSTNNTITRTGPIIRGRKNIPVRFYDDTNIDYIDITFLDESSSSPGLAIIPSVSGIPTPSYVDIELFDTLELDGELLLLASCEVNWQPDSGKNIVYNVVDKKQHGSISELEFTQSAKDFISSGERYLHGNGIINGFDLQYPLKINGGLALINGNFVITNPTAINIPLCTNLTSPPQTLDWILCVNDSGNIVVMPLTATKAEFFAKDGYSGNIYYLESVSFIELSHRKDLVPLYIYNATVSTIPDLTINSVSDVRKYVKDETKLIPLVWSGRDGYDSPGSTSELTGHFTTFEQVKNWINWTKSNRNTIKIRGVISSNSVIDLSLIKYPTVFDGCDGCLINLNCSPGISIGSGITLKNIDFYWNPTAQTYNVGNNISNTYNACLHINGNSGIAFCNNVTIDNCTLTGIFGTQRPPYITLTGNDDNCSSYNKITIKNNTFTDPSGTMNQCAIAFFGADRVYITNSLIENNIANNEQSIIVSGTQHHQVVSNLTIRKNNVGAIGYFISNDDRISTDHSPNIGIYIAENSAIFIGALNGLGKFPQIGTFVNLYGHVTIENNFCNIIYTHLIPQQGTSCPDSSLIISKNHLIPSKLYSDLIANYGLDSIEAFSEEFISGLTNPYCAIFVNGNFGVPGYSFPYNLRSIQIIDNIVGLYTDDDVIFEFDIGIYSKDLPGIIKNNIIKSFAQAGIYNYNDQVLDKNVKMDIIGNQLYYYSHTTGVDIKYICNENSENNFFTTIAYNYIDLVLPSGNSGILNLPIFPETCVIKNNTNHIDGVYLRATDIGKIVIPNTFPVSSIGVSYKDLVPDQASGLISIKYGARSAAGGAGGEQLVAGVGSGSIKAVMWIIPISQLNPDVKFNSASIYYNLVGSGVTKTLSLSLMQKSSAFDTALLTSTVIGITAVDTGTITIDTTGTPISLKDNGYDGTYLIVSMSVDSGGPASFNLQDLNYKFVY